MVLPCRGSAGPPSLQDLRHGLLQRAPPDPAEQFERLQPAIQPDIVAAVLDDLAGVQDGGAVAVEYPADHAVAQLETGMGQIHRHLPGEGYARRPAGRLVQVGDDQPKIPGYAEGYPVAGAFGDGKGGDGGGFKGSGRGGEIVCQHGDRLRLKEGIPATYLTLVPPWIAILEKNLSQFHYWALF